MPLLRIDGITLRGGLQVKRSLQAVFFKFRRKESGQSFVSGVPVLASGGTGHISSGYLNLAFTLFPSSSPFTSGRMPWEKQESTEKAIKSWPGPLLVLDKKAEKSVRWPHGSQTTNQKKKILDLDPALHSAERRGSALDWLKRGKAQKGKRLRFCRYQHPVALPRADVALLFGHDISRIRQDLLPDQAADAEKRLLNGCQDHHLRLLLR